MAVYTEVPDEALVRFIDQYGLGELQSFKGIAEGVENTNYLLQTSQGSFILTLYEKRVAQSDLPFFLGLMEHLAEAGVSCPTPMRDSAGQALSQLCGRPAAIISFLSGVSVSAPSEGHCAAVGEALAKLHLAGATYGPRRENALGPEAWAPMFTSFSYRADEVQAGLKPFVEQELVTLEGSWPRDLPEGVIHADLFPDNVFFLGGELSGLIDFYFACWDALAYDIAICLNAWCFENDFTFNREKGRALLTGYSGVRPLQARELDAMPILARGAAMRFLLTRTHDWLHHDASALVSPHDPRDYVARLKFHQQVASIAEYGL